jgi:hypothetical protein
MSYEEKGRWVYLLVTIGTYAAYLTVILRRADGASLTEVAYVAPMLWSIGIGIGLSIVGRIGLEIAKPSDNYKIDARDKEINRFGEYVAGIVLASAMVAPLGLAMAQAAYFWIANAIYLALVVSTVIGALVKLVAYRRGL